MKAQIWNKKWWIPETREKKLDALFDKAIKESGFHVITAVEHEFEPYGYTKLYLLSESHLAIHTFPEEGKSYVEISSCNEDYYNRFIAIMEGNGYECQG